MKRAYFALAIVAVVSVLTVLFFRTYLFSSNDEKVTLKVLCATSLMFPLEHVETAFEKEHPNVDVEIEGHGSIQVIRQVTELGYTADLLMVADYSLIPTMMYNATMHDSNQSYAKWYVRFATNSIVLAYTNQSKYSNEINSTNWYSVLARSDVKFGFPNPLIDALGYRTLITIQLAETYYGNNQMFLDLITSNFDPPMSSIPAGSNYTVVVPEVQQPKGSKVVLRASSIELIPLLQSGSIDYCFLYLSNAKQYGLNFVELPVEINLGSPQYQYYYQQVTVRFEQQRFASIGLDREGKCIYYGLTIPDNAYHKDLAMEFVKYILNGEGKRIFETSNHPILAPSFTDNMQELPQKLQPLVEQEP